MLTFLELSGDARSRGRQHGESLRAQIHELADIRRHLLLHRSTLKPADVGPLAEQQWQITAQAFPSVTEELEGIAEGAAISREALVVLNNYTDFRDIRPGTEGCTAVYVAQEGRAYLGQTWDMHGSAERFVVGLQVDGSLVLTVAGCVGMMGVNRHGAAVVVNNLTSTDAHPGVMWPALVRAMLEQRDIQAMSAVLEGATLSSGHNYMLADRGGCVNWETSGRHKKATWRSQGDGMFCHTNHYLDADMRRCEGTLATVSTTHDRYAHMQQVTLPGIITAETVVRWLSSHDGAPRSICSHLGTDDPDASKTCGGVVADLTQGHLHAWQGCLAEAGNGVVERATTVATGR